MSVNFTAVFDHRLTEAELFTLPARLNALPPLLPSPGTWMVSGGFATAAPWAWDATMGPEPDLEKQLAECASVTLSGPYGFSVKAHRHGIQLSNLARWASFLHAREVQHDLQLVARTLARSFGAAHLLFLPDSTFRTAAATDVLDQDGTVDEMISWLRDRADEPLASPGVLIGKNRGEDAWFHESLGGAASPS